MMTLTLERWLRKNSRGGSRQEPGSSGSTVSDYGLDDQAIGVLSLAGAKIFPLTSVSRPALRPTQLPVQWVLGVLSPLGKPQPGRDANHSPLSSTEVKNEYALYLSPQAPSWRVAGLLCFGGSHLAYSVLPTPCFRSGRCQRDQPVA
jgi:hypothetical protein